MKRILLFLCNVIMVPISFFWVLGIIGIVGGVLNCALLPILLGIGVLDFVDFKSEFIKFLILLIISLVIFLVFFLLAVLVEFWKDKLKESIKKKQKQKTCAGRYGGQTSTSSWDTPSGYTDIHGNQLTRRQTEDMYG